MNTHEIDRLVKSYEESAPKPRKRKRIMLNITIIVVLMSISILIGYLLLNLIAHNRYVDLIEEIKGRGEAIEFSEIAIEELEDSENAATYIKRAFKTFIDFQDTIDMDADEDYWLQAEEYEKNYSLAALRKYPDRVQIVRDYIKQNEETIELIHNGLQHPKANFKVDYENLEIPPISDVMRISRIYWHLLNLAILDNVAEQAIKNFIDMYRLALVMSNEHLLITRLVVTSLESQSLQTLKLLYENIEFTEAQLEVLNAELGKIENLKSFADVLISERCFSLLSITNEDSGDDSQLFDYEGYIYGKYANLLPDSVIKLDSLNYVKELGKTIDLSKKPYLEIKDELFALQTKWENETSIFRKYTAYSIPAVIGSVIRQPVMQVLSKIAWTTLAIELFKLRHGKLPQTLTELVEGKILIKLPVDPFTVDSLIYEVSGDKFRVFSKGFDDWDNAPSGFDEFEHDGNIVWKLKDIAPDDPDDNDEKE
ncbi:MAG: hypothetical protein K8S87_03420 [Planctomycetes bacterium]|nr:hypothetical protein [Planctomycetota bacterium]